MTPGTTTPKPRHCSADRWSAASASTEASHGIEAWPPATTVGSRSGLLTVPSRWA